jgi:hypothetical protein
LRITAATFASGVSMQHAARAHDEPTPAVCADGIVGFCYRLLGVPSRKVAH